MPASVTEVHGELDGRSVQLFTLRNARNLRVQISELGAHLVSVIWIDDDGGKQNLTLGHDHFEGWLNNSDCYLGATVGRFGNRIAQGKFSLEGKDYSLATNNAPGDIPCHLHGGPMGFHTKIWHGELLEESGRHGVRLRTQSKDGEEGYPGNLEVTVTYWLTDENELSWHAEATTDKATPINLINHVYWNLSGDSSQSITDHRIEIQADVFLPTDAGMIPTGEIRPVAGTPMDFTRPRAIGDGIDNEYEPLQLAGGYDQCWVLRDFRAGVSDPYEAAVVSYPDTGRTLRVLTNQPGIQFYTGNFLTGAYQARAGLCLETGGFPDAPNHSRFPSSILCPGESYCHELVWQIS